MDIKIQKKNQGAFYGEMLDKRRTDVEKDQEKERLRKLQEKQDKQRFNDRHWSDKELASMTQVCSSTHCFQLPSYYKKDCDTWHEAPKTLLKTTMQTLIVHKTHF